MSTIHTPAGNAGQPKVLTIDWRLLGHRLAAFAGRLFTSARYHAANTEYTPPSWMDRLHLSWFRLGLIALAAFIFTQKQINVTVSMGGDGVAIDHRGKAQSEASNTSLSMLSLPSEDHTEKKTEVEAAWSVEALDAAAVKAYVDRFARVARTEESKFGIPATAKLAMGILESEAGQAAAARNDNNHFPTATAGRFYDNAWSSWRAHSEDLERRFPELNDHTGDHIQWIDALAQTGYSRDAAYGRKLVLIIDHFGLAR